MAFAADLSLRLLEKSRFASRSVADVAVATLTVGKRSMRLLGNLFGHDRRMAPPAESGGRSKKQRRLGAAVWCVAHHTGTVAYRGVCRGCPGGRRRVVVTVRTQLRGIRQQKVLMLPGVRRVAARAASRGDDFVIVSQTQTDLFGVMANQTQLLLIEHERRTPIFVTARAIAFGEGGMNRPAQKVRRR
jgi:hypothetical protein